ncbi:MAG: glycosyltransferase family 4 protein [Flavobacteriales bacterium]|nr:glycosyltransferase family 4 protein [Flavobacteriales bacterium]
MDLPKPIHGMSNINKAILTVKQKKENQKLSVINTVPSRFAMYFGTKFWFFFKAFYFFIVVPNLLLKLIFGHDKVVYRPINGDKGQIYDLVYIFICRVFRVKLFIHHHSFNYLRTQNKIFLLLNRVIGAKAVHIVLGERMKDVLSTLYGIDKKRIRVISNAAFFNQQEIKSTTESPETMLVIGHLANLCVEKGLDSFVQICRELKILNVSFQAVIAGPCVNTEAKVIVDEALIELPEVSYLGSVYGEDKNKFFYSLDAFVFPSQYKNEAEPLVLYEAGQYGVYLFGSSMGCMADVIQGMDGCCISDTSLLVKDIAKAIAVGIENNLFKDQRGKRKMLFEAMQKSSKIELEMLLQEMESYELSKA